MAGLPSDGGQENSVPYSSNSISVIETIPRQPLTQACFVVQKWIGKVEVSVELSIVELYCYCMVRILIDGPNKTSQV